MGVITTAVPQASTSSNSESSSTGTARLSTLRPISSASVCSDLFVIDGSTLSESGVT